jgi:hypothetical protein
MLLLADNNSIFLVVTLTIIKVTTIDSGAKTLLLLYTSTSRHFEFSSIVTITQRLTVIQNIFT